MQTKEVMKMGLLNKGNATPSFEEDTATTGEENMVSNTKSDAAKTGAQKPEATAVAVAPKTGTAVGTVIAQNLAKLNGYKNVLHVEYNTLDQVTAQQGVFLMREDKTVLGDAMVFELLSFQDSYVVSPEDDKAPDDVVRYSDDGVTCSDGTDVEEHLAWLRDNGYPKAKKKQRVIVVGAVESATKSDKYNGNLVQIDVSPASRVQWQRYLANAAYGLKINKYTEESVKRIRAETSLAQGGGNNTFTLIKFSVAE